MIVPGVGRVIATALLATVADARQFKSGRAASAWLGPVPREHSGGQRTIPVGISKRWDRVPSHIIDSWRALALRYARYKRDRRSEWIGALRDRRGPKIAAVALANKSQWSDWLRFAVWVDYAADHKEHVAQSCRRKEPANGQTITVAVAEQKWGGAFAERECKPTGRVAEAAQEA